MTMATEPANDESYDDIFAADRDRGEAPAETVEAAKPEGEQPRDESGRFASKQQQEEPKAEVTPEAAPPVDEQTAPVERESNHQVPLSELKAERKRRQEFEQQLAEARARAETLERLFQQQSTRPQEAQPQPQPEVPDAFIDPQGYVNHVLGQQQQAQRNDMLNLYESVERMKHGDEKVQTALEAAQASGILPRITQQPNPWQALMAWHKDYAVRQEVGGDLEAFKKRVADEAVSKALAGLKAGNGAVQQQRFPASLASATATGAQGGHLTDEAVANEVFGSDRRARRSA